MEHSEVQRISRFRAWSRSLWNISCFVLHLQPTPELQCSPSSGACFAPCTSHYLAHRSQTFRGETGYDTEHITYHSCHSTRTRVRLAHDSFRSSAQGGTIHVPSIPLDLFQRCCFIVPHQGMVRGWVPQVDEVSFPGEESVHPVLRKNVCELTE